MVKPYTIAGTSVAGIALIFFIVVAATPSFFSASGIKIGAFKTCSSYGNVFIPGSVEKHVNENKHPFHITQQVASCLDLPTNQQIQACFCQQNPAYCNGNNGGFGAAASGSETCGNIPSCNDNSSQCNKLRTVQAMLVISILSSAAVVILGVILLFSWSDLLYMICSIVSLVAFIASLIAMAITASEKRSGLDYAYGFGLLIVAWLFMLGTTAIFAIARGKDEHKETTSRV